MTKKIIIDGRIIRSGTGRYVKNLIYYLEELDTKNDYIILVRKNEVDYYRPRNPRFKLLEANYADYSFGEQLGLCRLLHKLKPDLVHFCMPQQPLLYWGPSITTIHDLTLLRISNNDDMGKLELYFKKNIFAALLWIVSHRSHHILTPSEYSRGDLLMFSRVSSNKVTVTYESAEAIAQESQPINKLVEKKFIMYVGTAKAHKNNRDLIKAHQQLLSTYPDLRLVIVGKKDSLRLIDIAWCEKMKFKQIDFLGFVEDEKLVWLYQNCMAYVFPSFMEGFGLPGLEALVNGAPVVSSSATCLPEIYQDGAHYFNPHDINDMAGKIDDVLSSQSIRSRLINNAKKVVSQYSWRKMAEQTLAAYEKVLEPC